jgi:hypothetical protein
VVVFEVFLRLFNKVLNFLILFDHILIDEGEFNEALMVRAFENL